MSTFRSLHPPTATGSLPVWAGLVALVISMTWADVLTWGQEIHVRSSANIRGSLVTLGEIADIQGGPLADQQALRQLVLAPYSAERSVWTAREIREELVAAGWNLLYWEVSGSNQVQLHSRDAAPSVQQQQRKLAAIQGRVQLATAVQSSPHNTTAFAPTHPSVQRTGVVQAQWREELRDERDPYDAAAISSLRQSSVTSQVWAFRKGMSRGQVVTMDDLEPLQLERTAPNQAVLDAAEIVGQLVRSTVPAGRPILSNHLEPIKHVQRGKEVTLLSRVGPIEVSTTAKSLADATLGQSVPIESLDRKRQYLGQVIGFNTVQVNSSQASHDSAIVAQATTLGSARPANTLRSGPTAAPRDNRLR
jgi:flagella basal body P-ring formation protein FlgA